MSNGGLRGTLSWGPDERPKNFRESILWMSPNGDTPMLALSSRAMGKKYTVDDPEFFWWAEPIDIVRLQAAKEHSAGDNLITVDSGDPTAAQIKSNWGKATHLVAGDILMVEPAAETAADTAERLMVVDVSSETQFTVARGVSGTTPATIPNDAYLLLVGNAFGEGTAEPLSTTRNPVKYDNKTQIFKTVYEVTGTAAATRARTGDVLKNERKRRSFDHARALEMALMWGKKSERIGHNGQPIRTMAGIRDFIPEDNVTILEEDWGLAMSAAAGNNLMDALSAPFDYSSPAGDTRIAFVGQGALNAINRAILLSSGAGGVKIQWGKESGAWGMNFNELYFPAGRLLIKTHPLMSRNSLLRNSMFILDFSVIRYAPLRGRDTKFKDNIQEDGEDVIRGFWQTETSVMVDMGGQTLGYIGGFNATPAQPA